MQICVCKIGGGTVLVNRVCYEEEAKRIIEQNKAVILKNFLGVVISPDRLASFVFQIKLESSETHNRGKTAAHVIFILEGREVLKVMFKHRPAIIDEGVIELFEAINQLPLHQRSSHHLLPTYKILNMTVGHEQVSIWEFIEGIQFKDVANVKLGIERIKQAKHRPLLHQKLNRIDAILSRASISDLHPENVICRGLEGNDPELFLVDLENYQRGQGTLLGGNPSSVTLTQEEKELIDRFKATIHSRPFRYLPCKTMILAGAITSYRGGEILAPKIIERCIADGYIMNAQVNLEEKILLDVLNRDVPYFTEWEGKLYYGLPTSGIIIGERKQE